MYQTQPISSLDAVQTLAIAKQDTLSSYTGAVFVLPDGTMRTIVCESEEPSQAVPLAPQLIGNEPQCPAGYYVIN